MGGGAGDSHAHNTGLAAYHAKVLIHFFFFLRGEGGHKLPHTIYTGVSDDPSSSLSLSAVECLESRSFLMIGRCAKPQKVQLSNSDL